MNTRTTDKPTIHDIDADDGRVIIHTYRHRRGHEPTLGDKAVCGWIKRTPLRTEDFPPSKLDRCVVCGHMTGRWTV